MNQDIKTKWIEALRSGEYKQGDGLLKRGNKFCCLGVLCDLYAKDTGKGHWDVNDGFKVDSDMVLHYPPTAVVYWSGLTSGNPYAGQDSLTVVNDTGATFEEIANLIEAEL